MIRPYSEVMNESLKKLAKYQTGSFIPVKTGRPFLDSIFGGVLPGDLIVIAGGSGAGKSYEAQRLIKNIFELNDSSNYVCLMNSFEMKNLSTLIRDFNTELNKSKKDILTKSFSDEEKVVLNNYKELFSKGNFFIEEDTDTAENLVKSWETFLENNKDKKLCLISIDHTALVKSSADSKKSAVDDLMEGINTIKHKYNNVIFIALNQLNRNILGRSNEKSNLSAPNRGDLYASDTVFQLADYLYVTHNPYRLGINEYMKVNPEIYNHLSDHFSDDGKKVSFLTYGKMFYHVLKAREESQSFKDLYIEDIEVPNKEILNKKSEKFVDDNFEQHFSEDIFESEKGELF